MNIKQFINKVITFAERGETTTTFRIEGSTGIGKTAAARQIAHRLNCPCVIVHPSQEPTEDIAGVPKEVNGVLKYIMPPWFTQIREAGKAVLLIDEMARAPRDVRQALFSLIEEGKRTLRGIQIPDGVIIVVADNPSGGMYETDQLDPAFLRRMDCLTIDFDIDVFLEHIAAEKWPQMLQGFLTLQKSLINIAPESVKEGIAANPAGWESISRWINKGALDLDKLAAVDVEVMAGKVGTIPATAFTAFVQNRGERFVLPEELLSGEPEHIAAFFDQQRPDQNDKLGASIEALVVYATQEKFEFKKIKALYLDKRMEMATVALLTMQIRQRKDAAAWLFDALAADKETQPILLKAAGRK